MLLYCHGDCRENKIKRLLFCFTERVYAKYYFIFYDDALIQYLSAQYPKYLYDVGCSIIEELAKINRVTNNFPRVKYHHLRFTTIKYNTVLTTILIRYIDKPLHPFGRGCKSNNVVSVHKMVKYHNTELHDLICATTNRLFRQSHT